MKLPLLIATTNQGKITELIRLLSDLPITITGLDALSQPLTVPEETGATFAENALLKANYYYQQTGLLTLADDSGLEVDALGGAPGIHSARYAGAEADDATRMAKLLNELRHVPEEQRTARFKCSVALVGVIAGSREQQVFTGICAGLITHAPRGSGGFGYDPVFLDVESDLTFAELSPEEKAERSHRGQAMQMMRGYLVGRLN